MPCPSCVWLRRRRLQPGLPTCPALLPAGRWDPLDLPLQLPEQQHQAAGSAAAQAAAAALAAAVLLLPAAAAHASEAPPPDGMLEFVINWIEALGPWGPAAFVFTVAVAECIPLFPTQASHAASWAAALGACSAAAASPLCSAAAAAALCLTFQHFTAAPASQATTSARSALNLPPPCCSRCHWPAACCLARRRAASACSAVPCWQRSQPS